MTDPQIPDSLPRPMVERRRRRLSLVWLLPLLALLAGGGLVLQTVLERGPTITVSFLTAQGIEPGKTKVRFKDVEVGQVRAVRIAKDRSKVLVTIDLAAEAREFASADSRFWVVRPRLAGAAVSGLETVLSGAYIGVDGGRAGTGKTRFVGLETPPVVGSDVPGHRYRLLADDIGSLDVGSPVYFHRINVGRVERYALQPDGHHILLGVFINAPYDRFVTNGSRFWHASGVDLQLGADGLKLETQSLATILAGGVAFETPGDVDHTPVAENGHQFSLAANHGEAMRAPSGTPVTVALHFHQSVRGLTVGAPVDFRGVDIGQVTFIAIQYDAVRKDYYALVNTELYPDRLAGGRNGQTPLADARTRPAMVADLVRRGLRAQLRTGSLLTGQLYVALDFFPDAPPGHFDPKANPPQLPTIPGDLEAMQGQIQALLQKLNELPLDQLASDMHHTLTSLDGALRHLESLEQQTNRQVLPEVRDSLKEMRTAVDSLQQTLAPDAPLQQDSRAALQNMSAVARSLKTLTDTLQRQPESLVRGKRDDTP
ncbi:paraquat-inducible protein B [mine drainage metagenome]|uniref:Paraquat-inducible protein B n=1 Tax=mine drainage metagenome TaxID=410659 RepID=A0A1J5RGH1_9ZZZZ